MCSGVGRGCAGLARLPAIEWGRRCRRWRPFWAQRRDAAAVHRDSALLDQGRGGGMRGDAEWTDQAICWMAGRLRGVRAVFIRRMTERISTDDLRKYIDARNAGACAKLRHECQQHCQQPMQGHPAVQHRGLS